MNITLNDLLDAGVHFGHQQRRYNPRSKKFVYDHRHGISIINLEKTYACLETSTQYVEDLVASGKDIVFVGTKRQAQDIIREAASSCGMPYAASRWLGGTLTNYATVKRSIEKYKKYLQMEGDGSFDKMHNKEVASIRQEMRRMNRNFEGLLELKDLPAALFVVDTHNENIAVAEAQRMKIPVVALVDTNSDPSLVDYPVPGNDDAIKAIRLIVETITDAVQSGLARRQVQQSGPVTVTPVQAPHVHEEQVAPMAPAAAGARQADSENDDVPEVYSSDADDNQ